MNRRLFVCLAVALLLVTAGASAQMPYAGMQARSVKALSEQQVSDLNAGRGMGVALAAESIGYPGPSHVLELGDNSLLANALVANAQLGLFAPGSTLAVKVEPANPATVLLT